MNNNRFQRKKKFFIIIPIAIAFGLTAIVMWLWNATLVGAVAGVSVITYWQAMGLLVLSKILFGGFPGKGGRGSRRCKKGGWNEGAANLSNEEKEQFKSMWRERFERKFDQEQ